MSRYGLTADAPEDVCVVRDAGRLYFWCPGCDDLHGIGVGEGPGPRWSWNGDKARPVFGPSILATMGGGKTCHSFVGCNGAEPGQIIFLGDCTHDKAGQTLALPRWNP